MTPPSATCNRCGGRFSPDQWVEMLGLSGEWEKVGLIFQFQDDRGECEQAIAGLKAANYAREYRCTAAN